ncbi:uncharacterized protein LOC132272783 [Cornus florida]|uniref:uncharacterized protein LOC132272783 n=1 Tax=Cornus florida TaxID=4283 RepID=UPI00289AF3BB|nr:uncharacterized protein LOC132272783 [Cornus florida]
MPKVLSANLERTIKPKFKLFRDLGFFSSDVVEIVSSDPKTLTSCIDNWLGPSILALKSVLDSNMDDVSSVLKRSGWFSRSDLAKTMTPNIEFIMKSCGLSSIQITQYVYKWPRLFMYKLTQIREHVKGVDKMGIVRKSKMFLSGIQAICSMSTENWELKLEVFKSLGFSEDDILSVFRRAPQLFALSERKIKATTQLLLGTVFRRGPYVSARPERKIKAITQFLLSTGKFDISYVVVNHPELFGFSVANRLRPRLNVMEVLESRNLLLKMPSLKHAFHLIDK